MHRRIKIGKEELIVHDGTADVDAICNIMLEDKYELLPIKSAGHSIRWCLDIGASVGAFTHRVKRLWPDAHVIAAEPASDSAELFLLNTKQFTGIDFHEAAVIPGKSRSVVLSEGWDAQPASRFLIEMVKEVAPWIVPCEPSMVRGIGICELLSQHGNPDVDILKLDCEGSEAMILEELRDFNYLEKIHWIGGEWHHRNTIPRIREALSKTHEFVIDEDSANDGHDKSSFIGHRKD